MLFVHQLRSLGYEVTENNDLILSIYDPVHGKLVNTTLGDFPNDFLVVSLLKGHYQGNKGYQLEVLPNVNGLGRSAEASDDDLKRVPLKVVENKSKRAIPLSLRYLILKMLVSNALPATTGQQRAPSCTWTTKYLSHLAGSPSGATCGPSAPTATWAEATISRTTSRWRGLTHQEPLD